MRVSMTSNKVRYRITQQGCEPSYFNDANVTPSYADQISDEQNKRLRKKRIKVA